MFKKLLRNVEDSQLNYAISRTPFSATISLKSSFLNRFPHTSQKSFHENIDTNNEKIKTVKAEKSDFKDEVDQLEKDREGLMLDHQNMKKLYDKEKSKNEALELEIKSFREEALKIKKEKRQLKENLKLEKEMYEALRIESKN